MTPKSLLDLEEGKDLTTVRLSYDGFGLNDANDLYKPRILTFVRRPRTADEDKAQDKLADLLTAAPAMLEALRAALVTLNTIPRTSIPALDTDHRKVDSYTVASMLEKVIRQAEGGAK